MVSEPSRPRSRCPRIADRHFPAGGLCSPLVYANYLLVLFQQCRQPVCFLYACVKLPILLGKIVGLPLDRRDTHCADELHFGACSAALRCGGSVGQLPVCVVSYFQNVPFGKGVRERSDRKSTRLN